MARKIIIAMAVLVTVAIVCWVIWVCLANRLYAGYVTGKRYEAAHTVYMPQYIYIGKTMTPIMMPYHYSDAWYITVKDGDITDEWQVSCEDYLRLSVGDWVERK